MYKAIIKYGLCKLSGANRGSLYAIESLLNRSIGLPCIIQDINLEQRSFNITMSLE
jgi:hypothetical protein